jgi:hypothetical protein
VRWRAVLIGLFSLSVLVAGATVAYASGTDLQTLAPGWTSDGAAPDTFWDSPVINIPGVQVTDIHCHGRRTLDFQYGATRPARNPCYLGNYDRTSGWGVLWIVPGTQTALYQAFQNGGAYTYYVANLIPAPNPPSSMPGPPAAP